MSLNVIKRLTRKSLPESVHVLVYELTASLLCYPGEELQAALPAIREAGNVLPSNYRTKLYELITHLERLSLMEWQQEYVQTFDFNRRADLHLTYHAYGDKRQRGLVLLQLKRVYDEVGVVIQDVDAELPDFLPLILELSAIRPDAGRDALQRYRAPLELIRRTLSTNDSPYSVLLELVTSTLPALRGDEADAVRRLITNGPPEEAVGLEPYAPNDIMPSVDVNDMDARVVK